MIKKTPDTYGKLTIFFHWLSALIIIGQFSFGIYMLSLSYYDSRYKILPHYHKSIGILFSLLLIARIIWMLFNKKPKPTEGVAPAEHFLARLAQFSMLTLLIGIVTLGYLVSTANGSRIEVFNWFTVPATITSIENQEDWAAQWHYWLAVTLICIVCLHTLAALKHHFIDKDKTLLRMLGRS